MWGDIWFSGQTGHRIVAIPDASKLNAANTHFKFKAIIVAEVEGIIYCDTLKNFLTNKHLEKV